MSIWDGYKPGATPTPAPVAKSGIWAGYNPTPSPQQLAAPRDPIEQKVISSFQAIDPSRRSVVLQGFLSKAQAGDKVAARKLQLLSPHLNAPAPATPDYQPKDLGSKLGAALYGFGKATADSLKNTAEDVATSPHLLNAGALALASIGKGDHGDKLAHNKQVILNEANKSSFARGIGLGKTVADVKNQPLAPALARIGGRGLENALNVATLGEGTLAKQAGEQAVKAVGSKASVRLATQMATKGEGGYIRNMASGQFARSAVHPDDAAIMAAFIDHARGITKLNPQEAQQLELDASRIAEHYNIGGKATSTVKLANAFDRTLSASPQALRGTLDESGHLGLPDISKPNLTLPKGGPLVTASAGKRLVEGAKLGAGYSVAQAGQEGTTDPGQLAKNIALGAATGGGLSVGIPALTKAIGKTAGGVQQWIDNPVKTVAEARVLQREQQGAPLSEAAYQQAVKDEANRIRSNPKEVQAISEAHAQVGANGLTADTGKQPVQVPVTAQRPTKGTPTVMTAEQAAKQEAINSSPNQNLSSRAQQFGGEAKGTISLIEQDKRYKAALSQTGGDKVIGNEQVRVAAEKLGPLDHQVILNAKPLDKIDTVTLARAKATLDAAAQEFLDSWQNREAKGLSETQVTKMAGYLGKLEAGYKVMSAEPGRATQIQSTFIKDAIDKAAKLRELMSNTKGATPEQRNQRIAQDLADFDRLMAKAKSSSVFSGETLKKLQSVISEYATAAKLTSPLTHAVNIASNLLTLPQRAAENVVRTAWGAAKGETTLEEAKWVFGSSQGLKSAVTQFGRDFKQAFNPTAVDIAGGMDKTESVKPAISGENLGLSGAAGRAADITGKTIRTPFNVLTAADNFFKTMLRDSEYHQLAFSKAYQEGFRGPALSARVNELVKAPTSDMADRAEKVAKEFTFQGEPGPIASAITGMLNKVPILRLLIPFVRTPTELAKFQAQRSALGVFAPRNVKALMAGGIERREAVARLGVGAGMTLAAVYTVNNLGDRITGIAPTEPGAKDNFYAAGKKPYSILLNGKWVQYNRFQPVGMYLTQAVGLRDALMDGNSKTAGNIFSSLAVTTARGMADLPFVSGVSNVIAALSDPSNLSPANKAIGSIITGLIPNASRDLANAQDPVARQAKSISDQVKTMIPGLKETLPARTTAFGQDQTSTQSGAERGLIKITSNDQSTKLTQALDAIGRETGYYPQPPKPTAKVNGQVLPPDKFKQYQQRSGQLFATKLEKALSDSGFGNLSAEDKQRTVAQMITDARTTAANEIVGKQKKNPKHKTKRY